MPRAAYDTVILAGGQARRLHGASKPDVMLAGRRLVDHCLASVPDARRRVVVGPATLQVSAGVLRTQESPVHGGPVAGIEAGLSVLHPATIGGHPPQDETPILVLACDMPFLSSAVPLLLARLTEGNDDLDGACLLDGDGRVQWLAAAYRPSGLHRALTTLASDGGTRNAPVRRLAAQLTLAEVLVHGRECADIDTWSDHEQWERIAPHVMPLDPSGHPSASPGTLSADSASTDIPRTLPSQIWQGGPT